MAERATQTACDSCGEASLTAPPENPELVLRAASQALQLMTVSRWEINVDVSTVAPAGCERIAADVFVPQNVRPMPLLWVVHPGRWHQSSVLRP